MVVVCLLSHHRLQEPKTKTVTVFQKKIVVETVVRIKSVENLVSVVKQSCCMHG